MQIIKNTIRVRFYSDQARVRLFDYLFKNHCLPKGSGIIDGHAYLLFDTKEYLFYKEKFYIKKQENSQENLREY